MLRSDTRSCGMGRGHFHYSFLDLEDGEVHDLLLRVCHARIFCGINGATFTTSCSNCISAGPRLFALACVLEVDVEAHPRFLFRLEGRPHFANRHVHGLAPEAQVASRPRFRFVSSATSSILSSVDTLTVPVLKKENRHVYDLLPCATPHGLFFPLQNGHVHDLLFVRFICTRARSFTQSVFGQ